MAKFLVISEYQDPPSRPSTIRRPFDWGVPRKEEIVIEKSAFPVVVQCENESRLTIIILFQIVLSRHFEPNS